MPICVHYQRKRPASFVNLTSLMDVLTIILFFILANYSSDPARQLSEVTDLPRVSESSSESVDIDLKNTVPVVVTKDHIAVEGRKVQFFAIELEKTRVVQELAVLLKSARQNVSGEIIKNRISVQSERAVPFKLLDPLLVAAGKESFSEVEFVAIREARAP